MRKVLPIFALFVALFLGACASTGDPRFTPQPNTYTPMPAGFQSPTYATPYEHVTAIFTGMPGVMIPSNPILKVSWDLWEPYNMPAQRNNCQVSVKGEFEVAATVYRCLGIERNDGDFLVTFEIQTDRGPMVKELNLSYLPGDFTEGGRYEWVDRSVPFFSFSLENRTGYNHVVWQTHESVRTTGWRPPRQ